MYILGVIGKRLLELGSWRILLSLFAVVVKAGVPPQACWAQGSTHLPRLA